MRVLFSPVGTADPITALGDGPMLHICRHYQPDKVVLYLSEKMARYEDGDRRYSRAIELLQSHMGNWKPVVETIESQVSEVFRYDAFIAEFRSCLTDLIAGADEVLLNVSSGTPQMQQALVALYAFGLPKSLALQVTTPRADANRPTDREDPNDYDLELLWEANDDNTRRASRCLPISTPHFKDLLLIEDAAALVKGYDYEAAASILQNLVTARPNVVKAISLVHGCKFRLSLDHARAVKCFAGTEFAYDPSKNRLQEYVATLEVKLRQQRFADFVRAVTPAISHALDYHLASAGWPHSHYLDSDGRISVAAVASSHLLQAVFGDREGFPYNRDLLSLLEKVSSGHAKLSILRKLISFEGGLYERDCLPGEHPLDGVRNRAAHEIVTITEKQMKSWGGLDASEAMAAIRSVTSSTPGLYDRINVEILKLLAA